MTRLLVALKLRKATPKIGKVVWNGAVFEDVWV